MRAGRLDWGVRVHLAAVQAALSEEPYRSAEDFAAWIGRLARDAADAASGAADELLVAFPEAIGLPLLFTLADSASVAGSTSLLDAAWRSLRGRWGELAGALWQFGVFGPSAVLLARAVAVHDAYVGAFREAARATGATLVAGTAFLPDIDWEAGRGTHVTCRRVYNVAYTFAPGGTLLGRTRKVHLTPGLESRVGLSRGRVEDLRVMAAPFGNLGVAVCLDGWYEGVVAALDAQGAEVLVQPSANAASWTRPWPPDPRLSEGDAWLERGLRALLQGRVHLRYALNPMLVGEAFGFAPRGRSSVLANVRHRQHAWIDGTPGLVAMAESSEGEDIVGATVELSGSDGEPPATAGG